MDDDECWYDGAVEEIIESVVLHGGASGVDAATGPGDEPVWRRRRPTEPAPESPFMAHRRARPWTLCDDCRTESTCREVQDLDRCP